MKKEIILRGHHLRILHDYLKRKGNEFLIRSKDERVIKSAIEAGHSEEAGINIVNVMKEAMQPNIRIKLIDTIDDVCRLCNEKSTKKCKEFIPYGISAASDDRATLYYYGFQRRNYTSEYITRKLMEKEQIY